MLSSFQGSSLRQSSHPQSSKATDCPASVMMGKAQQGCPCRRFLGEKKHEFVTPPLPCEMSSWYFVNARLKPEWAVWGREGGGSHLSGPCLSVGFAALPSLCIGGVGAA